jgi:4-hydroxy-tetrahydrodipicolinate reductase
MNPKLIVNGVAGRMGRRIVALAVESGKFDIVAGIELPGHPELGKDIGVLAGREAIGVQLTDCYPAKADILIDFSLPAATDKVIEHCRANSIALVMCTTGLNTDQQKAISYAAEKIPVIYASNTSVGMNVLFGMIGKFAKMLGDDYDIEIIEAHHRFKKDAPSGSAKTLAEKIAVETDKEFPQCLDLGREGTDALRSKGTIGIQAVRLGDTVGEHSVMFGSLGETVTISHSAHSRDTFANGALRAALWLLSKESGLYSMADVLGLSS